MRCQTKTSKKGNKGYSSNSFMCFLYRANERDNEITTINEVGDVACLDGGNMQGQNRPLIIQPVQHPSQANPPTTSSKTSHVGKNPGTVVVYENRHPTGLTNSRVDSMSHTSQSSAGSVITTHTPGSSSTPSITAYTSITGTTTDTTIMPHVSHPGTTANTDIALS